MVIFLLLGIALAIRRIVNDVRVLYLGVLSNVLLNRLSILCISNYLARLMTFIRSIRGKGTWKRTRSVKTVPVIKETKVRPVMDFIYVNKRRPTSHRIRKKSMAITSCYFLLFDGLFL